jgi:hypothetical protein
MLKALLTASLLLLINFSSKAQQYATARIFETGVKDFSYITIVYENGATEIIQLEKFSSFSIKANVEKVTENQKAITILLNTMSGKGYELQHIGGTPQFLVFVKRPQ